MIVAEEKDELKVKLKEIFGYSSFRGNQEIVIKNILGGRNTFEIMPPGAGKALCYQLPALVNDGLAVFLFPHHPPVKNKIDQSDLFPNTRPFFKSKLGNKAKN